MYRMLYNDSFLFDPFDETRIVSSASITTNVNAASYLDFTIAATHPLYNTIEQRSGTITLYSDNEKLFQGQITAIDMDMDGNKSVTCSSALDWLKDVQLRPYSTDQAECNEYEFKLDKAPDALDAYFQWLIDQYNAQNKDGRYFTINVNQAADLTNRNIVYFASTSPRSVADAIEEDILKTFGGYLVLRYDDDQLILDLYSDIHEMNEQVIDYGENILDISRNESTDDQYTAVYPIGKTPQYTAEQQKYHDEKDAYDEMMKRRDETEKAAINKLKKEEEAEQKRITGITDKKAKRAAQDALQRRKQQRQAREQKFSDETKRLQDAQKIKDDKNNADKTKPNPITIESLDNGGYPGDLDIFKDGDVIYSVSYVARYGYKEFVYSETDVDDKKELLKLAVAKLKSLMAPVLTIDVRAVDQALYNPKHRHLFAGQAVRVRSKAHKVDEFMMVSSIDLDLIDPSQTTATLGVEYDTLTGQQSSFLRNLNSQIVASVDAVDKLGENVKVTEITLGKVETVVENTNNKTDLIINTVDDYKWMTDTAWGKADDAQADADKANQGVTDTNIRIDNIKMATDERIDEMKTDISDINTEIDNTKAEVEQAKQTAEQIRQDAQAGIEEAKQQAEDIRTEANTAIDKVKTDLDATEAKAQQAASNASAALGGLSSANTDITNLRTEVDRHTENITNINGEIVGVRDTVSGVAETANSALSVATTNTHAINEQSTRIDTAYSDIETTRTSVSEVKQTADGLKVNLETNYLDKDALGANYASKLELSATSESITSTVSKTYATKAALEGLQNIADAAIETWSGRAVPTASNPPASTWTTDALKRQHSGDIYYDMSTGKSYRWGSADGKVYSWSMIADSDITKAIADAAKAQQTADGAKQDVVNLSDNVKATYTSKSDFKQTSDEIKASVNEVASANETNTKKIAEVSVKADGISATLAEQAETLDGHATTIGQLSVKADGLQTKFEQTSDMANLAMNKSENLITDPGFENGAYWNLNGNFFVSGETTDVHGGKRCLVVQSSYGPAESPLVHPYGNSSTSLSVAVTPGHTYRIEFWEKCDFGPTIDVSNNGLRIYNDVSNRLISACNINPDDTEWTHRSIEFVMPSDCYQARVVWRARIYTGRYLIDDVAFTDVTGITKASEAITKTSELQQSLDGFKQTVSETYTTKDEFDNLQIGGRNLLKGTKVSKQLVGNNSTNQCMTLYNLSTYSWAHLDPGDYMISADISYEGTISGTLRFQRDNKPWEFEPTTLKKFSDIVSNTKRKAHIEFCVKNAYDGASKGLAVRFDNVQGTVTFSNVKLEKGNKATTWSPAPEDLLDTATASTTYTTKSEFTQTANEIKGTVAEQATTIDGHTNSIANLSLKADKFETDISQTSEQVDGILGRTTKLEQDLGGFKQSVDNTYISKTDADKNLVDAINAMQIGGTNLLLDTLAFGNANPNNISAPGLSLNSASQNGTYNQFTYRRIPDTVTTNNANGPQYSNIPIARGKTYTASFWYRGTADLIVYFYGNSGYVPCVSTTGSNGVKAANQDDGNITFAKNSEWKRYWVTWTLHATSGTQLNKHLLFRRKGTTGYIDIAGVKLEEGSKATEWSPSPFDTLYASNIEKTYAPKTMVQQTEDRITQTVEATYASKTQLSDEMKKSVKTTELRGRMDGNYWFKLGRLTMEQQGKDFHIDFTGGRGYNALTSQNSQLEIHVRSSNGSGTLFFAVTLNRLLNADMYQVKAFTIDATHIDLYLKSGSKYDTGTMAYYGQYRDFSGAKQIDDISTAEGTELTVLEQSLSTKSYVDQTAESVSIGVVEAYKSGEHGDALTTSSQLQTMKESITSTVASTYESKSDATLKGKAIDGLINPDFATGTMYGWHGQNYVGRISTMDASVGGPYLVCEKFTPNTTFRVTNDGVITVKPGNTYRVSANLRASHDFIQNNLGVILRKADGTAISFHQIAVRADFDAAGNVWTYRYVDIKIPDKITAIKIGFGSDVTSAAGLFVIKGLRIEDVTLALAAQDTANKGMKQSSEAIQSLEKFQQSVEETYVKGEDLSGGSTNILIDTKAFGDANPNGATNGLPGSLGFPTNTSYQGLKIREIPASNTSAKQVICEYAIKDCQGGQWYTASFFAKGSGTFRAFFYTNGNVVESKTVANDSYSGVTTTGGGDGCAEIKVDGRWRRYNVSWRLDPKNTSVFEKRFLLRRDTTSGNIAVCGVKLEKGTIPSDWSPSPFDLAQQTSLNGELTKYTEKTTFEQTKKSFEWNIKSLAKYGPDKIPNGDPRSDLETIMVIEKDSNPPVYTFTVNNTSAPQKNIVVSRTRFALTSALIAGRTYRFSFEARVVSGSVPSADFIRLVCGNDNWSGYWPWLDGSGLGTTWKTFTKVIKVTQNCTKGAIEYNATSTGAKKFYIRNVSIMDVTEGANAQSGVNELDTLIRYTSNGIEVGRKTNGQYTGPKALVNSNGSFDVVKADNTLVSRLGENLMGIMRDPTLNDYRYSVSTVKSAANTSGAKSRVGVNIKSYGMFMLNGYPCNPVNDYITCGRSNEMSIEHVGAKNTVLRMDLESLQSRTFTITNAKNFKNDTNAKANAINNGSENGFDSRYFDHTICCCSSSDSSSDTSVNGGAGTQVMVTAPGMYCIQLQIHGRKPNTANSWLDVRLGFMDPGSSSWTFKDSAPGYRVFETSDSPGWIQRPTPVYYPILDVGTRIRIEAHASHSGFKMSTGCIFRITRMPFSSAIN